ncbi:MAG: hypothetical protein WBA13_03150 [Microcoleaceae cyanobacterium]
MAHLNPSTLRRLQSLPQMPSVWEGDRRLLSEDSTPEIDPEFETSDECIIWVDGSEGIVRAMDMVSTDVGIEAVVRTLLRAMEHPQSPTLSARPQKIVVRDREIQFFLRGALQELGIVIEYVPHLPLIDEIFRGLQEVAESRPPQLPPGYTSCLAQKAYAIWKDAPWKSLAEHQIIAVELNCFDVETLYISTLGKLGMDYGVLMYRSMESLKQFRQRIVSHDPTDNLEEAFLTQDCLFVTFDRIDQGFDDEDEEDLNLEALPSSEIQPSFGNLHPLEGLRSVLYEEEAGAVFLALEAFHRFLRSSHAQLQDDEFPEITRKYRIATPVENPEKKLISVQVSTLPDLADELYEMVSLVETDESEELQVEVPILRDDLVPPKTFLSLAMIPWETTEYLRHHTQFHQGVSGEMEQTGEGLPIILLQTTKPKAQIMIQSLKAAGGLTGICFNPGEDPMGGNQYDLSILQTQDGDLHLVGEFLEDDPVHQQAKQKWEQRCEQTKGWCGLVIAMGATGASKGQPGLKHMMALLEVRSLSGEDLGLGLLELMSMP